MLGILQFITTPSNDQTKLQQRMSDFLVYAKQCTKYRVLRCLLWFSSYGLRVMEYKGIILVLLGFEKTEKKSISISFMHLLSMNFIFL